jgi:hypothetical protein
MANDRGGGEEGMDIFVTRIASACHILRVFAAISADSPIHGRPLLPSFQSMILRIVKIAALHHDATGQYGTAQ